MYNYPVFHTSDLTTRLGRLYVISSKVAEGAPFEVIQLERAPKNVNRVVRATGNYKRKRFYITPKIIVIDDVKFWAIIEDKELDFWDKISEFRRH